MSIENPPDIHRRRLLSRLSGIFGTDDDIVLVRVERWGANLSGHSFFHEAGPDDATLAVYVHGDVSAL